MRNVKNSRSANEPTSRPAFHSSRAQNNLTFSSRAPQAWAGLYRPAPIDLLLMCISRLHPEGSGRVLYGSKALVLPRFDLSFKSTFVRRQSSHCRCASVGYTLKETEESGVWVESSAPCSFRPLLMLIQGFRTKNADLCLRPSSIRSPPRQRLPAYGGACLR